MSDIIMPLALLGKALFFLTFLGVMMFDMSGYARVNVIFVVMGGYLVLVFGLCIAWSPLHKRARTVLIIAGYIALATGLTALVSLLV